MGWTAPAVGGGTPGWPGWGTCPVSEPYPGPGGQSTMALAAASRMGRLSISTQVSPIAMAGQEQWNERGPGGGSGQTHWVE